MTANVQPTRYEGSIDLRQEAAGKYAVMFLPYLPYLAGGAVASRRFSQRRELLSFLLRDLGLRSFAVRRLLLGKRSIPNVILSDDEILRHGLDSAPLMRIRANRQTSKN